MSSFKDGPAAGKSLMLKRAPVLLRVVRDRHTGNWDALDQIDDVPSQAEEVFVYRRQGEPTLMHLNCGRRGGSGMYHMADYTLFAIQPDEAVMRDSGQWQEWCKAIEIADQFGGGI